MSTGNVESWSGNMAEIGPLYPFVGAEFALFVVGDGTVDSLARAAGPH